MQNQFNNRIMDSLQDLQFHMSHEIAHRSETLFIYNFEFDKEESPLQNNICGTDLVTKLLLKSHMKVHTGKKPYLCCILV